ncbi:MAG: NAD(P)H-hydrate dehydratase [Pseudomonadota bacterium]
MDVSATRLPKALYRAAQVKEMDRVAIENLGVSGLELMTRAGRAAFAVLRRKWPEKRKIAVLCGAGNNAGDGYVVAGEAFEAGLETHVFSLVPVEKLRGDALAAFRAFCDRGGAVKPYASNCLDGADLLVDALLGTGLDRPVRGVFSEAIDAINEFSGPVLAVDIPSGLCADTGNPLGVGVRADHTVTFIGLKRGLFTGNAAEYCGEISFSSLDVPDAVRVAVAPYGELLRLPDLLPPPRSRIAHKGHFGHVLVVGGEAGFSGAIRLAAEAAARVGAGLVSIATRSAHAGYLNLTRPELMCHGIESQAELAPLLARASVVALGPGLGQSEWAAVLFDAVIASGLPVVLDADALNLLAQKPCRREHWLLTPHPGEAARLLATTTTSIQRDRFATVEALQRHYGGVAVLKGAGTLICTDAVSPVAVCRRGNPGMASGGMGDVLTGVIAGLIAQKMPLPEAAKTGVCLHAAAADLAAIGGERGLLAGDLMKPLKQLLNRL